MFGHIFSPRLARTAIALFAALILLFTNRTPAHAGDNNVLWDYLYHSANGANPRTELVPGESYSFLRVAPDGNVYSTTNVEVYLLANWLDLSSANVRYWDGAERWVAMTWVKNITASFRGRPSRTYDLWRAIIPARPVGTTVYYRVQAVDGSAAAYLKAANGQLVNPMGQHVRGFANDPDDYSYTVVGGGATATPTRTPTRTPTGQPTFQPPTNTPGAPTSTPNTACSGAAAGDANIRTAQVLHDSTQLTYRSPFGSIPAGGSATLKLRTCANDVTAVQVLVWRTGDPLNAPSNTYNLSVGTVLNGYAFWQANVPAPSTQVDQWYQFRVIDGSRTGYYAVLAGGNNSGPGAWSDTLADRSWRLGTSPAEYIVPSWMQDAVIYQIFPERFRNGDTSNDPPAGTVRYGPNTCGGNCLTTFHTNWNDLPGQNFGLDFFGGDLQGIIDKINDNYFTNLGVNVIYLNPIFEASSNHGYDTNDYYNVAARFGGNAKFDQLIIAANAKNIRIVLDAVFNHAGADSKYVDGYGRNRYPSDVGACEGTNPYRSWFTQGTSGSGCTNGWGWVGWMGYETIPEFVENAPVKEFFFRGGSAQSPGGVSVSQFWLNKGIAGWRFDVAQDITHSFFQEMRPYYKSTYGNNNVLMLGEVTGGCDWNLYKAYVNSAELDSAMNYCFRDWARDYANGGVPSAFDNNYNNFRGLFAYSSWRIMMNLISSHDSPRMLNLLNGDKGRLKLTALLQMTLPGAPSVYYGDEVALPGGGDPDNRRTYPWADRGGNPDNDMYNHFRTVITLRKNNSALRGGDVKTLLVNDGQRVYSYLRWDASQKIVVVLNNGTSAQTVSIPVASDLPNGAVLTDALNGGTYTVTNGTITVSVNGLWGRVLVR
jgi:glycosidase